MNTLTKPTGLNRVYLAAGHSIRALQWLLKNEAAFKQEVVLAVIMVAISLFFPFSVIEYAILFSALLLVMLTEIINTAIEAAIDRIGAEIHPLSGLAKDLGSLAVMVSCIIAMLVWGSVFFSL